MCGEDGQGREAQTPALWLHVAGPSRLWREWGLASLGISSLQRCPGDLPNRDAQGQPSALGLASEP